MPNNFPIIDGHTHVYKEHIADKIISSFTDFYQMHPISIGQGTVRDVLDNMQKHQIEYTILANFSPLKNILDINEWTVSLGAKHKELIPLVSVHPEMSHDLIGLVEQYVQNGAKGIKMHTGIQLFEPNDIRLKPVYTFCEEHQIPITFHCGETSKVHVNDLADIKQIYPVLEAYQDLPFILTHMAGGTLDDVYRIADSYSNVHFDTSITVTGRHCIQRIHDDYWEDDKNTARAFLDIGCNKVVFGSDYPFGNPGDDIKRIMTLDICEKDKRNILGKNAFKIYNVNKK